jgi:hypothetical protein
MASAEEKGQIVISFADLEESKTKEVLRFHTGLVSQATKTPSGENIQALPVMTGTPYKAKRMIVSFISDAADTIESEESDWSIPIAFVNEKTGRTEFVKVVKMETMNGFTAAGTVDVACTAGVPARLAYLDAPQGYLLTLAAGQRYHAYIGDDTA